MLIVKLEIWPGGDETRAKEIGRAEIGNVSNLAEVSDYVCSIDGAPGFRVRDHRRSDGAWRLVRRMLGASK